MSARVLGILLAAACVLLGWQTLRLSETRGDLAREEAAHQKTIAEHARQREDWQRESRRAVEAARAEEQRRTAEVQKAADEAEHARMVADRNASDARVELDGLRDQLAALAARLRGSPGGPAAAVPGPGVAGSDPLDLLSGLLARHSAELVDVGQYADRLRVAGLACERAYDALTQRLSLPASTRDWQPVHSVQPLARRNEGMGSSHSPQAAGP